MDICSAEYTDKTIQLEKGDKVFFYTDGLVELKNKQKSESFTKEHLKKLLVEHNGSSCFEFYGEIDKNIKRISGGSYLNLFFTNWFKDEYSKSKDNYNYW